MTKSKVLDLAREVGMEDDKLLLKLKRMGVKVRDKKATEPEKKVSSSDEKIIKTDSEKEIIEKRARPRGIGRTGEQPRTKPARGKKEKETPEKPEVSAEAKAEGKEILRPGPMEAAPPRAVVKEVKGPSEVKKEGEKPK